MAERSLLHSVALALMPRAKASTVPVNGGGWFRIFEADTGNWQRNIVVDRGVASTYHAVFACETLIARDIAKNRVKLVQEDAGGVWGEIKNPSFSPVLRKPNHFQTRNQFWECWMLSKLRRGNAYILKQRDARRVVVKMYALNPDRVTPLVANDGSVFYQLANDELSGIPAQITVPASEIIHDRFNCLFHPLVGLPPIYASGLAAIQGINIQRQSIRLFKNNSQPGGILTAPGHIEDDTANRIKTTWEENFGGENGGRLAVLGDDLKYEKLSLTAEEAQLIDQLKWTAQVVCSTYHVPPYKIGVGDMPSYNNVQALNVEYFTQCLQSLIEDAESCLDEGLGLGEQYNIGTEFDIDNLLRMDSSTQMDVLDKGKNYFTPNEGRARINLPKTPGGDAVYRQQQDFSLEALAKRDAQADPFKTGTASSAPAATGTAVPGDVETPAGKAANAAWFLQKSIDSLPPITA